MGVRPIPVPIDADGLMPEGLDKILGEWDEEKRGCKRPRVLYTVPGKEILHAICECFDIDFVCPSLPLQLVRTLVDP